MVDSISAESGEASTSPSTAKPREVDLHFGALADSLATQLSAQGLPIECAVVRRWQQASDAVVCLFMHGHISESTALAARRRIMRQIVRHYAAK